MRYLLLLPLCLALNSFAAAQPSTGGLSYFACEWSDLAKMPYTDVREEFGDDVVHFDISTPPNGEHLYIVGYVIDGNGAKQISMKTFNWPSGAETPKEFLEWMRNLTQTTSATDTRFTTFARTARALAAYCSVQTK